MKKILWLVPCIPHDQIRHAGGQNCNYYLNYFHSTGQFDISLIGLDYIQNKQFDHWAEKGIETDIYYRDCTRMDTIIRKTIGIFSLVNIWSQYNGLILTYERMQIMKRLKQYKYLHGEPEYIIFHWTVMGLLQLDVKKIFPSSKTILIEEDVTYQNYQRRYENEMFPLRKGYYHFRYQHLKMDELRSVQTSDKTVVLNIKDKKMLLSDGIKEGKVFKVSPFFHKYYDVSNKPDGNMILFYGAMNRSENYESVIWFIENVMPKLENKVCLEVIGANPPHKLLLKGNNNVKIERYVEDISHYLEKAVCMVVPLLNGAGIKIKVLEGMTAGLTILTNRIGIEGIEAVPGKEYMHCENVNDYVQSISQLLEHPELCEQYGNAARRLTLEQFNVDQDLDRLIKLM